MSKHHDILVIGGGPGGTPAAMALAQADKKVFLVELDIDCIPERLVVIGGGPIGIELAQIFSVVGGHRRGDSSSSDTDGIFCYSRAYRTSGRGGEAP